MSAPQLRLSRQRLGSADAPQLDAEQLRAVTHRGSPVHLLGGPGSGKTTVAVEAVASRVDRDGLDPGQVLVLAPTRLAAARLREQITARLVRTVGEPLARTAASFAFGVLRLAASRSGDPAPRLISGPEQDFILGELLAGHRAGDGIDPGWPDELQPAIGTRGFRSELRDLLMRAIERGISPDDLAQLGQVQQRPDWVAAANVFGEYLDVTGLGTPGGYDPAAIARAATAALLDDDDLLDDIRHQIRYVVVDDAHEATPAVADLIKTVVGARPDLLLTGDPDSTTQTFRGADPSLLLDFTVAGPASTPGHAAQPGGTIQPVTVVLGTSWRQPPRLREVSAAVAARIGAVGGGRQRRLHPPGRSSNTAGDLAADSAAEAGRVVVQVAQSAAHETALIAEALRREHLLNGVPWSDMAVIVRGGARSVQLRRGLMLAQVPVDVPLTEVPVRDQPAVVPFLDVFECALNVAVGSDHPLTADQAQSLLLSALGGTDSMGVRRLRRALRAQERVNDRQVRPSDDLLVEALLDPARLAVLDRGDAAAARRVAEIIAAGVQALSPTVTETAQTARPAGTTAATEVTEPPTAATKPTAETVLWALWSASRLASPWRRAALAGGPSGVRADRDLDAVVALFDSAARFTDRLPQAGPGEFVAYLRGQEVPGDTLAERAAAADAVTVLTPASAAGRQWPIVVVAGVQEGVWPDLRLRGSLLGSEHLVDVLVGREGSARSARKAILDDETRLFQVAVSRAQRMLLVTAVRDDAEQPSPYLDIVDPPNQNAGGSPDSEPDREDDLAHADRQRTAQVDPDGLRAVTIPASPLTLAGLVARLRQVITSSAAGAGADPPAVPGRVRQAAAQLARLARAGVPGADPDDWFGLAPVTDSRPLLTEHPVRISPSKVEEFDRCALRWLLQHAGGTATESTSQSLGTVVHALAADLPDGSATDLLTELHRRWGVLEWGPGWVGDAERVKAERIVGKLADYLRQAGSSSRQLLGTELAVNVELQLGAHVDPVQLVGRVDRLERDQHGLHVIDFKTGKSAPTRAQLSGQPQLLTYQVAVQAGAFEQLAPGAGPAGAVLVQLGTSTKQHVVQKQSALSDAGDVEADGSGERARELLTVVATGMGGGEFAATVNDLCDRCPVRTSCPAHPQGRRVTS